MAVSWSVARPREPIVGGASVHPSNECRSATLVHRALGDPALAGDRDPGPDALAVDP